MAKRTTETTGQAVEERQETGIPDETRRSGFDGEKEEGTERSGAFGGAGSEAGGVSFDARNESGFYCYIGPNLKKLIQTGTIYRGTRRQALAKAAEAIKAQPLVKTLIVSGDALPTARVKVRTPGNVLYANYRKLAGKEGK